MDPDVCFGAGRVGTAAPRTLDYSSYCWLSHFAFEETFVLNNSKDGTLSKTVSQGSPM